MSVYERHTLSNGLRVLTAPLGHAQSVACYVMLAAGSRYENASNRGHRALRRAHVLQGDGAAADRARHRDGGRLDRRRVQRVHVEGVHGLLHPLRGRAARPGVRRARRHAAQLEVRLRGARAREGRDHRGDEHVRRHAARLHRLGVRGAAVRIEPARLGDARHEGDDRGRVARRRSSTTSASGTTPSRMVVGCAGAVGDDLAADARRARSATCPADATGRAGAGDDRADDGAAGADPPQGLRPGERRARRPVVPDRPSRPVRAAAARNGARHRHVVAAVPRGARAARPRVLRLRVQQLVHGRGHALRAGGRRPEAHRGGRRR